jgi:proteasome lid subunit RPN8/RPN11
MTLTLQLTEHAWNKWRWMTRKPTEVGGFGISKADNYALITDIALVPQIANTASIDFDDAGLVTYVQAQAEAGLSPLQSFRVWFHTHPSNSAEPSATDWETCNKSFAAFPWSIMAIMGKSGNTTAHLCMNIDKVGSVAIVIPVEKVADEVNATLLATWDAEHDAMVKPPVYSQQFGQWKQKDWVAEEKESNLLFESWKQDPDVPLTKATKRNRGRAFTYDGKAWV